MKNRLLITLQSLLPQHALSQLAGKLADAKTPWLKNFLIQQFIQHYQIDLSEALIENPAEFASFNDFFIRQLKPDARSIAMGTHEVISPADGTISQIGFIREGQLLQAKQSYFDLNSLLGHQQELTTTFLDGEFATVYLAPHNYHRVHMPLTGTLRQCIYVPGKLFSVNRMTTELVPQLFARNERLITVFDTIAGPMIVILVGALLVGSIQTVWMTTPIRHSQMMINTPTTPLTLEKGTELGHFKMGSTVIVLFTKDRISWSPDLLPGSSLQLGQVLANILK
jgi:phosphatidylserine decarboxylase